MSGPTNPVTLDEFLQIAAKQLGTAPEVLARLDRIGQVDYALSTPDMGFGDVDRYPTVAAKAAALMFHIAQAHALPDANKRSAWLTMLVWLRRNGFDLRFEVLDAEATVTAVASGVMSLEDLALWLHDRIFALE